MVKVISLDSLNSEIKAILNDYNNEITRNTKEIIHEVSTNFKKNTKKDAPKGNRRKKFYTFIDVKKTYESISSATDTWHVKNPEYRLAHLIKDGHATRNGGRTKSNDFIDKNYVIAEKELEEKIIKVVK